MQVGISTASYFTRYMVEDTPSRIAACGASICEIFLNTFSEYTPAYIELLKARVLENDLTVYSVHPMGTQYEPQLFSLHPRQRKDAIAIFRDVLRAACTLGAKYYVMHGPASMRGTVKNMELSRIGPILSELCDIAGDYGIRIAWENVSWCLFSCPDFAQEIAEACASKELCFTLDIKQAARSGYSPLAYLDAIGRLGKGRLANVHVCDYAQQDGRVIPMLPGRGACDYAAIRDALRAIGYEGPALVEVYSDLYENENALCDCYQMLRSLFAEK